MDLKNADTEPIRAGEVKKGMVILLKGSPCKVVNISTSKTGKHGHAKANITGLDIFTGKKYQDMSPTSHNMTKPIVTLKKYLLVDILDDGYTSLMDEETSEMVENIRLPTDKDPKPKLGNEIKTKFNNDKDLYITVTYAMNKEAITGYSEATY